MTTTTDTEARIRDFIATNLLYTPDGFSHDNNASFLQEGIIDSLGVMELVAFVQTHFKIVVEQSDVIPDNFDSVSKLAAFVQRKAATRS